MPAPAPLSPIEASQKTIGQIFDDAYAFEIPAYQRPYAWEIDQVQDLLNDLLDAMDSQDSSGVYFLGSIVLIKSPNDPLAKVIDGQQRLTTLTILLSVLRDLTTDEEKRIDRRRYVFQRANADRGTSDRFRVLLRARDRAFLHKYVQQPGATNTLPDVDTLEGSQQRIGANTHYLRERLEALEESIRDALVAFIVQRCYLVVVAVPTAEAARRIFTVLNARGLDLTPTDILKADLLDRAGETAEAALADRWEAIENQTSREGFVELFGHLRMIYEREKPRAALEVAFPAVVKPFQGDANQFMSDVLEPIADAFALLKDTQAIQRNFGLDAAKAVRSLIRIDNKDWLPPAILRLWKRKPGENKVVAEFLVQLERVAYFLFVVRYGINDRIARFAAIMNEIDPSDGEQSSGLTLAEIEQAEFIEELDGNIYQKGRVCKPVLQRLDEALSTLGASYDDLVSIEHVLPQTVDPNSEWAKLFPNESERKEWTHRLANLVFLTRRVNTRASNWDFEKKKDKYFRSDDGSSPFVLTQDVLQTTKWTIDHLIERQQKLLQKLADVWRLDILKIQNQDISGFEEIDKGVTDSAALEAQRQRIIAALSDRFGAPLLKKGKALYTTAAGDTRIICTLSKRYTTGAHYWYGYTPQWDDFLAGAKNSFLVLGGMDRDNAYAIPHSRFSAILKGLHRTSERHWHVMLEEGKGGQIELVIPGTSSSMGLGEFELKLG